MMRTLLLSLLTGLLLSTPGFATATDTWWVWFTDKGTAAGEDAPVYTPYVEAISDIAPVRHTTRWFNGVSVNATEQQLDSLRALSFVRDVQQVGRYGRSPEETAGETESTASRSTRTALDYGGSETQCTVTGAVDLHSLGYDGTGITIAIFDDGFYNYDLHPAFSHLSVAATWDFADNETDVTDDADHGLQVLGMVGAYAPGSLIGSAWNATYLFARTEVVQYEKFCEEDNWIAAAEWAWQNGADIISTSVGYTIFDDEMDMSHTINEMDGKTALITQAAQKAAMRGIIVVAAAGNEVNAGYPWGDALGNRTLLFPADGDSVITVGNVRSNGEYYYSSSRGPTVDGRIKPDISAMGVSVRTVSGTTGYGSVYGTSFATPLTAGIVAMLKQAHASWDPIAMRTALRLSGAAWDSPDIRVGWGLIDGLQALAADSAVFGQVHHDSVSAATGIVDVSVTLYDGQNQVAGTATTSAQGWFRFTHLQPGDYRVTFSGTGYTDSDTTVTLPALPRELHVVLNSDTGISDQPARPTQFVVGPAVPNPANPSTAFHYELPGAATGYVTMRIYDAAGRLVYRVSEPAQNAGEITWHAVDQMGRPLSSGAYYARISHGGESIIRSVVVVR